MAELHTTAILRNTDHSYIQTEDDNSTIRQVLADIERLMNMLSNELDQNKSSISSNLINYSPQQQLKITSSLCYPTSSPTITSVTITDDNHRLIEHLRHRIARLEHERNVLLTSYQLLIKLLK
ncbi:unnamed protein product [Rotaria sordida]|uniref:Uncharacterized protein n=1 Tax=Rotaria sordida TaxID=392033 RepID=A0A819UW57_9BILA|nr:unnamed protein product [Rotaria sordida]CAF1034778.1 unnamed protein product [Rotaria sordida]CAF1330613.1 unnamed protein product [Rotaria sordida]CAF1503604.1 unnamed protein product [Rotaria sordida]CAF1591434.1 unnamed protein product [Rotaria sordida]